MCGRARLLGRDLNVIIAVAPESPPTRKDGLLSDVNKGAHARYSSLDDTRCEFPRITAHRASRRGIHLDTGARPVGLLAAPVSGDGEQAAERHRKEALRRGPVLASEGIL